MTKISFDAFTPTASQDFTPFAKDADGTVQRRQNDPHYPWEVVFKGKTYPCESPMDAHRTLDALQRAAARQGKDGPAEHHLNRQEMEQIATKYKTLNAQVLKRNLEQSGWSPAAVQGVLDIHASLNRRGRDKDFKNLNQGSSEGAGFTPPKKFEKA